MLHAQSRTALWNDETQSERALQIGKVQNLRVASRRLNRVLIPGGQVFSFWKQVGRATTRRGFARGRLLREGCLMPAVGGGLCQLSNALYDVALQAQLEIVERHAHSQIVPGSQAQSGRDATVAWNYVDFRFRAPCDLLLRTSLTRDELVVQLWAKTPKPAAPNVVFEPQKTARPRLDVPVHSCASCAQTACFRHRESETVVGKTAFLLDEPWPEWQDFVRAQIGGDDDVLVPLRAESWVGKRARNSWKTHDFKTVFEARTAALWRSFQARRQGNLGAQRLNAQLETTELLSRALAKKLAHDATHVVVAQSFLPFLWRDGALGGRTFDVLMTRLPFHELHRRLDAQSAIHPERATLREFRAPQKLVETERTALQNARFLVSPHPKIAVLFANRVLDLSWKTQTRQQRVTTRNRIVLFPGPTAARKGAYELREVARALKLEVWLWGSELEGDDFWRGLKTRRVEKSRCDAWINQVAAVVQPALAEDCPRFLLEAWSRGVPIIATAACGLNDLDGVQIVPFGDEKALQNAILNALVPN